MRVGRPLPCRAGAGHLGRAPAAQAGGGGDVPVAEIAHPDRVLRAEYVLDMFHAVMATRPQSSLSSRAMILWRMLCQRGCPAARRAEDPWICRGITGSSLELSGTRPTQRSYLCLPARPAPSGGPGSAVVVLPLLRSSLTDLRLRPASRSPNRMSKPWTSVQVEAQLTRGAWFRSLGPELRRGLVRAGKLQRFPKRSVLVEPGSRSIFRWCCTGRFCAVGSSPPAPSPSITSADPVSGLV